MPSFRDIKRKARRDLHQRMLVPALYIVKGQEPKRADVRVHTKFAALGDMKGTNFNYAERAESQPRIIIMRSDIADPAPKAIISIETGEAYRISYTEPADDISITAFVERILGEELYRLELPIPATFEETEDSDG